MSPYIVAVNPNSGNVYVTNTISNTVSVISSSNQVIATVPVGLFPGECIGGVGHIPELSGRGPKEYDIIWLETNTEPVVFPNTCILHLTSLLNYRLDHYLISYLELSHFLFDSHQTNYYPIWTG